MAWHPSLTAWAGIDIEMIAKEAKAINHYLRSNPPKYDNQSKDYERENLPNKPARTTATAFRR